MAHGVNPIAIGTAGAATATVFGVFGGLGGITHGIGEVLQGNVSTGGLWMESWASGPIATNMGGEPGISVLPTALAAGVTTLAFSAAIVVWSAAGVRRRRGGPVLILLSTGLLLSGGGIGPPLLGILAGVAALGSVRRSRWVRRLRPPARRLLARSWRPLFAVAAANAAFLVVGSVVLVYAVNLNAPYVFLGSFYFLVLSLIALIVTGAAYDAERTQSAAERPEAPRRVGVSLSGEA